MSSHKPASTPGDLNKPHEENDIQIRGILYFGAGLAALIVVTFALMWALLNVLMDYNKENQGAPNPMQTRAIERLPPEPRLQAAPGFGVDSEKGRVSLELREPQAEYRELRKQWAEIWEKGEKDPATGMVKMLPIDAAKEKIVEENPKSKSGADAEAVFNGSRMYVTDQSSGRMLSEKRR